MSDLPDFRDARLKKALDSAPDDEATQPGEAVRENILRKGRAAAAQAQPRKPKRRWFDLGLPWNSALASVLVIGFVTVLWKTQPPPAETLQVQAPTPKAERQASVAAEAARAETQRQMPVPRPVPVPQAKKIQPPRDTSPVFAAPPPPPPSVAMMPAPTPAPAPQTVTVPAASPAPAPVASRFAPAAAVAEQRAAAIDPNWTELRVLQAGESVRRERSQLPEATVALLESVLRSRPVDSAHDAVAEEPELRLQLRKGDQMLGWLELGKTEARWISTGGQIVVTRPERLPELIEALRPQADAQP
ncbi:MAG TPA: hypothetical protein VGM81_15110 [Burkholderiaceae bacterium]|jgi:hypothetical protein